MRDPDRMFQGAKFGNQRVASRRRSPLPVAVCFSPSATTGARRENRRSPTKLCIKSCKIMDNRYLTTVLPKLSRLIAFREPAHRLCGNLANRSGGSVGTPGWDGIESRPPAVRDGRPPKPSKKCRRNPIWKIQRTPSGSPLNETTRYIPRCVIFDNSAATAWRLQHCVALDRRDHLLGDERGARMPELVRHCAQSNGGMTLPVVR